MSDAPLLLYTSPTSGELFRRRWRLIVVEGEDRGLKAELFETPALVGAAPAASLILTDDTVSRYHAELDVFAEGLRVRDLDSTNGTFLEGESPIREGFIENGGTFRVGNSTVRLIALDEPAASEIPTDPELIAPDGIVEIGDLVAASDPLLTLLDDVRRVAAASSAVMFRGPRGSGKATLARVLHDMSDRKRSPFVSVSAKELRPHNYRRLLFGEGMRIGLFTRAHRGSLFLEDVEQLAPQVQAELRQAIDRGEIQPLGTDDKTLRVDVRMIGSTSIDLRTHPNFDPALIRRIAVVELPVPALSDRKADLAAIASRRLRPALVVGRYARNILEKQTFEENVDSLLALIRDPLSASPEDQIRYQLQGALLQDSVAAAGGDVSAVADRLPLTTQQLFARLADHRVDVDLVV